MMIKKSPELGKSKQQHVVVVYVDDPSKTSEHAHTHEKKHDRETTWLCSVWCPTGLLFTFPEREKGDIKVPVVLWHVVYENYSTCFQVEFVAIVTFQSPVGYRVKVPSGIMSRKLQPLSLFHCYFFWDEIVVGHATQIRFNCATMSERGELTVFLRSFFSASSC